MWLLCATWISSHIMARFQSKYLKISPSSYKNDKRQAKNEIDLNKAVVINLVLITQVICKSINPKACPTTKFSI